MSNKDLSPLQQAQQNNRNSDGTYRTKPGLGTSAADELSGIGEEVVAEFDSEYLYMNREVRWYVDGVDSVSIIRNEDGSLSADVGIYVDSPDVVAPALRWLDGEYPGAYSREFSTPYDWVDENPPSEYLLGEETQDPDDPGLHIFRVPLESTSVDGAVKEAGKVFDSGNLRNPLGPAAARVHEAVKHSLAKKQRIYDIKESAIKWALKATGAPEDTEIDSYAFGAIDYAVDDFLRDHPNSFDDVPADELGEHIIKARCLSGDSTTNRHRYGQKAEDPELETRNQGRIRFWIDNSKKYVSYLRVHVDPPTPSDTTH